MESFGPLDKVLADLEQLFVKKLNDNGGDIRSRLAREPNFQAVTHDELQRLGCGSIERNGVSVDQEGIPWWEGMDDEALAYQVVSRVGESLTVHTTPFMEVLPESAMILTVTGALNRNKEGVLLQERGKYPLDLDVGRQLQFERMIIIRMAAEYAVDHFKEEPLLEKHWPSQMKSAPCRPLPQVKQNLNDVKISDFLVRIEKDLRGMESWAKVSRAKLGKLELPGKTRFVLDLHSLLAPFFLDIGFDYNSDLHKIIIDIYHARWPTRELTADSLKAIIYRHNNESAAN